MLNNLDTILVLSNFKMNKSENNCVHFIHLNIFIKVFSLDFFFHLSLVVKYVYNDNLAL